MATLHRGGCIVGYVLIVVGSVVSAAPPESRCGSEAPAAGRRCPDAGCFAIRSGGSLEVGDILVTHCDGSHKFWVEVEEDGDFVIKNRTGAVKWRASGKLAPTYLHRGIPSMARKGLFFWLHALNKAWQKGTLFSGGFLSGEEKQLINDGQFRPASSGHISRGPARLVVGGDRLAAMVGEHTTWAATLTGIPGELRLMENGEMILANNSEVAGHPGAVETLRIPLEEGAAGEPIKSVLDYYCLDYHPQEKKVWTHSCHSNSNQRWRFGAGALKTAHNFECLDLTESLDVIVGPCETEAPNQRWSVDDEGRIRTPSAGKPLCLEAKAGPGGVVRAVRCTHQVGQRWTRSEGPAWRSGAMPDNVHDLRNPPPATLSHDEEL